ncbi:MAG: phage holin family protein [Hyphomicrobiaceae bacterium]
MDPVIPPPSDSTWIGYTAQIMWVLLAMAGGVARYLDSYLRTGVLPKIGILFAHATVSGFSGYMVAQVILRVQPDWALVAAGVGGYLGTQGIDWAASVIKNRALPGSSADKGE